MKKLSIVICSISISFAPLAAAHDGATGIVKERMHAMKLMGKASKAIAKQIRGKTDVNLDVVADHANVISQHSDNIPQLFPQGSLQGKSEALAKIWLSWEDFKSLSQQTSLEAMKLSDLAHQEATKPTLMAQFKILGKSCKACHKTYRKAK
jgi:cytochrome c556